MDYTNAKIDVITARINELYKKSKEEGLNEAEKEEQAHLRRIYIDRVKANFRSQLAGIEPKNKQKKYRVINIVSYSRNIN